ncbi:MAG: TonB-dependent receptor [Spirochaetes bacterium]|nr:TonB-dependent receptor [Spirochaetota bacterium]
MKKSTLIVIACCFMAFSVAFAQEETAKVNEGQKEEQRGKEAFSSKEIIVKDSREQTGVASIITEKEVKNSPATNLVDVINERVPSFYTGNNRVMGYGVASSGSAKMSVRGMGISGWGPTTGLPILINGLDTTTSIMGHPIADIFTMKNVDRIEVLHGPQPVLYGSGAMGGIVNVITRRQETEGFSTELSGSYGSYNTTDDYAVHQGKIGFFDYGVSYNFQRSDGHRSQRTQEGFRLTSAYRNHNATARFGFEIGDHWYAGFNGYLMRQNIHDSGMAYRYYTSLSSLKDLETFDIAREGCSVNLMNRYDRFEGMLHLYWNHGKHEAERTAKNMDSYEHEDTLYGFKATETAKLFSGNKTTIGVESKRWGGTARFPDNTTMPWLLSLGNYYVKDKYIINTSAFGLVEQKIMDYVLVSGGARYTHDSKFGDVVSWQTGISIYPLASVTNPDTVDMKIHSSVAQGFKLPDLRQLYLFGPYPVRYPNPWLSPEKDLSVEYGIESTLFNRVTVALTGYRMYVENMFVPYGSFPNNYWINQYQRVIYDGIESSLRYTMTEMVSLWAGYSYIDNSYRGKMLVYVPRHRVTAGATFEGYNAMVALECSYVRDVYNDTEGWERLSNYLVFNSRLAYTFLEHYRVFVNLYNITNRKYQTFYGYPMPGFHMMGGLSVMF